MVGFAVSAVELATGQAIYGFSVGVVIPIGAIGCGFVAAAGYSAAARLFHIRPSGPSLAIPLASAMVAFVATHWFTWMRLEIRDDQTLSDLMSFGEYLRTVITETSYSISSNSTTSTTIDRVGTWGYALTALEITGFALGGWFVAGELRNVPWCSTSGRFMRRSKKRSALFADEAAFLAATDRVVDLLDAGDPAHALDAMSWEKPTRELRRAAEFSLEVELFACPECDERHGIATTRHRVKNNWTLTSQIERHPGRRRAPVGVSQ